APRMSSTIHTEAELETAVRAVAATDPGLAAVYARAGLPPLRRRAGGFAGLAAIVVGQQLSTASAAAIWGRLQAIADPFDHACVLRARRDRLVRVGLSAPKIRTLKARAESVERGEIELARLGDMPADDAHAALVALHGVGPWT